MGLVTLKRMLSYNCPPPPGGCMWKKKDLFWLGLVPNIKKRSVMCWFHLSYHWFSLPCCSFMSWPSSTQICFNFSMMHLACEAWFQHELLCHVDFGMRHFLLNIKFSPELYLCHVMHQWASDFIPSSSFFLLCWFICVPYAWSSLSHTVLSSFYKWIYICIPSYYYCQL